ncbi:MAG: flagellar protein FlgN [Lachnospiraceae bacterium]|jgi:flagellar biosynthesis/type III secretory pathway chaperone|nr:flagellar protein FlgN [Lachnospiraceae bacterium]
MEDLIGVLDQESGLYEELLKLSGSKTPVIVAGDLDTLAVITDDEQSVVNRIVNLDRKREQAMKDIANVLNKDVRSLTITELISLLGKRPAEARALASARDRLKDVAGRVRLVNEQNQQLLQSSLEMVQFEMNIIQAAKKAPETANYTRMAGAAGATIGYTPGGFDAKQ